MKKYRLDKMNELVKRELSDLILKDLKDPRIKGLITVTKVEIAPDLKTAKIFISIFGVNEEDKKKAFIGLNNSSSFLKYKLMKNLELKYTPELFFKEDDSLEKGFYIIEKLNKLNNAEKNKK